MPAPFAPRRQALPLPSACASAPLASLRAIEESSRQMLASAQAAQWGSFWQLALQCKQQVQAVQAVAREVPDGAWEEAREGTRDRARDLAQAQRNAGGLSPSFGNEKQAILLRILQNDAMIRVLTEPGAFVRAATTQALGTGSVQLH